MIFNRFALVSTLVVAPLALTTACRDDEVGQLLGGVAGNVCNPLTGRPAANATVTAQFFNEVTQQDDEKTEAADENGFFRIGGLPVKAVSIQVEVADEFRNVIPDVNIEALTDVQLRDPGCRDAPTEPGIGELLGQICNRHTGEYVSSGTVTVLLPDGTELTVDISEDGSFVLPEVPAGNHVVYVEAPGFQKTYQVVVEEGGQTQLEDQTINCQPYDPLTTGMIVGTVCGAEVAGEVGAPLAGARVFVVQPIDGIIYEDETLPDGSFTIAGIPTSPNPGPLQVRAEKGGFTFTWNDVPVFPISEEPDGTEVTADVGCQPLVPDDERRYLVVQGTFDKIEQTLARMELSNVDLLEGNPPNPADDWINNAFGNADILADYDAVFVNCGVDETDFILGISPAVKQNMREYIENGGSLYVSDWSYDLIEAVWPERIDFLSDDLENSAAEYGEDGTYTMDVVEPGLREYQGADQVDIDFAFGAFALVSQVSAGVTTYLRGDIGYQVNGTVGTLEDTPITVGFTEGTGRVIFTSFHQESDGENTEELVTDGPEDLALRYIIFSL
jgi:hypothetical protein